MNDGGFRLIHGALERTRSPEIYKQTVSALIKLFQPVKIYMLRGLLVVLAGIKKKTPQESDMKGMLHFFTHSSSLMWLEARWATRRCRPFVR